MSNSQALQFSLEDQAFCEKVQTLLDTEQLAWTFTRPTETPQVGPGS
jgi:hypothetical protein